MQNIVSYFEFMVKCDLDIRFIHAKQPQCLECHWFLSLSTDVLVIDFKCKGFWIVVLKNPWTQSCVRCVSIEQKSQQTQQPASRHGVSVTPTMQCNQQTITQDILAGVFWEFQHVNAGRTERWVSDAILWEFHYMHFFLFVILCHSPALHHFVIKQLCVYSSEISEEPHCPLVLLSEQHHPRVSHHVLEVGSRFDV